jgi:hypothetical protein
MAISFVPPSPLRVQLGILCSLMTPPGRFHSHCWLRQHFLYQLGHSIQSIHSDSGHPTRGFQLSRSPTAPPFLKSDPILLYNINTDVLTTCISLLVMNKKTQRISHALNQPGSFSRPSDLHRNPPCVPLGQSDLLVGFEYTLRQPVPRKSTCFHFSPIRVDYKSSYRLSPHWKPPSTPSEIG